MDLHLVNSRRSEYLVRALTKYSDLREVGV